MVMMHRQYVARRVAAGLLLAMVVAAWMAVASEGFSLEFVDVSPKAGIIGETVYLEAVVRNNAPLPAENGPDVPLRAEEVVVTFTVDGRLLTTKTLDIYPQDARWCVATWVADVLATHTIGVSIGGEVVERTMDVLPPGPEQLVALVREAVESFFAGPQTVQLSTRILPEQAAMHVNETDHWVLICAPVAELRYDQETGLFNVDEALGLVGVFGPQPEANGFYLLWANSDGVTASLLDVSGDEVGRLAATHAWGTSEVDAARCDEVSATPIPLPSPALPEQRVSNSPVPIPTIEPTSEAPLSIWIGLPTPEGAWSGGILLCGATPIPLP
jgi:hypothetical protein